MWIQLNLSASQDDAETLSDLLMEIGACAVTLEEREFDKAPVFSTAPGHNPLWEQIRLQALFASNVDTQAIEKQLIERVGENLQAYHFSTLEDEDWQRAWMKDFKPMCFGETLWIYPSWYEGPAKSQHGLFLDPGLAFGTGTHPTTALCLTWLARTMQPGQSVIDYGCGSGILALAAYVLGAFPIKAIDNDPQAIEACQANMEKNGVPAEAILLTLPEEDSPTPADIVLANILAQPLIALAPVLTALVKPGGHLLLSGILKNQMDEVENAYSKEFVCEARITQDDWGLLVMHTPLP